MTHNNDMYECKKIHDDISAANLFSNYIYYNMSCFDNYSIYNDIQHESFANMDCTRVITSEMVVEANDTNVDFIKTKESDMYITYPNDVSKMNCSKRTTINSIKLRRVKFDVLFKEVDADGNFIEHKIIVIIMLVILMKKMMIRRQQKGI